MDVNDSIFMCTQVWVNRGLLTTGGRNTYGTLFFEQMCFIERRGTTICPLNMTLAARLSPQSKFLFSANRLKILVSKLKSCVIKVSSYVVSCMCYNISTWLLYSLISIIYTQPPYLHLVSKNSMIWEQSKYICIASDNISKEVS